MLQTKVFIDSLWATSKKCAIPQMSVMFDGLHSSTRVVRGLLLGMF
jgi:hypothetical protein